MSRKDFELIASALRDCQGTLCITHQLYVAQMLARKLAITNPRFDRQRFIEACTKSR